MTDPLPWEYKCVEVHPRLECKYPEDMRFLNDLGSAGWELVGVVPRGESMYAYFKRPTLPRLVRDDASVPAASKP
jgi:hypothetical protein